MTKATDLIGLKNKVMKNHISPISSDSQIFLYSRHSRRSQVIYITILLGLILSLTSLFFVSVDVNVQSRGILTTLNRQNDVVSAVYGHVLRSNLLENMRVCIGDTLVIIDTTDIYKNMALISSQVRMIEEELSDLSVLTKSTFNSIQRPTTFSTPLYNQEYHKFIAERNLLFEDIAIIEKEYSRHSILHSQKVIADSEYEQFKYKLNNATLKYRQLIETQLAQWQTNKQNRSSQLLSYKESLLNLHKEINKCNIISSVSGYIQNAVTLHDGMIIFPNQKLCVINPEDELIAETYISPIDVGFIYPGQEVKFRVDAFNSNQWGMLSGEVYDIAHDISVDNGQLQGFRVLCKIRSGQLTYRENLVNVKKGMTLTANFILIERTLAQIMFDDVSKWINPNNKR